MRGESLILKVVLGRLTIISGSRSNSIFPLLRIGADLGDLEHFVKSRI